VSTIVRSEQNLR